jgi:hypothetical protein
MHLKILPILALVLLCLSAPRATADPQPAGSKNALDKKTVDLLKLVDATRDACEGAWVVKDNVLTSDNHKLCRIQFPYRPPAEYDFQIQFARQTGSDTVAMMLAAGGTNFAYAMGSWQNTVMGFTHVGGRGANANPTTVKRETIFENGKKYDALIKVRKTGVQAYVNNVLISEWKTDYSDMENKGGWSPADTSLLGLGTGRSPTKFYKVEVVEITGEGTVIAKPTPAKDFVPVANQKEKPKPAPAKEPVPAAKTPAVPTGPIDFPVTSAARDPDFKPSAPPADLNTIERPDYQKQPKPLLKSLTSATCLMVITSKDGSATGFTQDIIANIDPDSRKENSSGIRILRSDGDPTMKTALEEAVRAVRMRYPIWEPGYIDLSFGEKHNRHGGPSAGTAFALLMLSALEGFELDPKCAITGDITVDWKVRKVGGVTAKIRGAALDKAVYAAIPDANESVIPDLALLHGNSALYDIQIFSIATLQDALAIAKKDKDPKLAEAIKLFADLHPQLAKLEKITLQKSETKATLKKILELAPNHLSAKYLLASAEGKAAKTLSAAATLYKLDAIMVPYNVAFASNKEVSRATLPQLITANARKQYNVLRPIAHKDLVSLLNDQSAFTEAIEQYADRPTPAAWASLRTRISNLKARSAELAADEKLGGALMREGY